MKSGPSAEFCGIALFQSLGGWLFERKMKGKVKDNEVGREK
jgi:hypothetical protein